jgi:hypothetical protein
VDIDYTLSSGQVCEAVAIKSVERTGKPEFLSHLCNHKNKKLSSFVPDWTASYSSWVVQSPKRLGFLKFYNASLDIPAKLNFISERMVTTQGVIFDTVITASLLPLRVKGLATNKKACQH